MILKLLDLILSITFICKELLEALEGEKFMVLPDKSGNHHFCDKTSNLGNYVPDVGKAYDK